MKRLLLVVGLGLLALGGWAQEKAEQPTDVTPIAIYSKAPRVIYQYQSQLVFYALSSDIHYERNAEKPTMISYVTAQSTKTIALANIHPARTINFKRRLWTYPIKTLPNRELVPDKILACTYADSRAYSYVPMTPSEKKALGGGVRWVNSRGTHDDYCAVLNLDGAEVYRFQVQQAQKRTLIQPIGVRDDGAVAIAIGERISIDGFDSIGKFREIQIWTPAKGVKKIDLPKNSDQFHLYRDRFYRMEL